MYIVYWTEFQEEKRIPLKKEFELSEIADALKYMEVLRKDKREGAPIGYITYVSENPDNVTKMGVDVVGPDYEWKKRRI